jgi:hypothetical protein
MHLRSWKLASIGAIGATAVLSGLAAAPLPAGATGNSSNAQSLCIAHHPQDYVWYTSSCTGHDEPEIDPLSSKAGSAQDLTWTLVLPTNGPGNIPSGPGQVDSVGPTFWTGGTVTDPNSLFGQAFLEVQFYPNSIVQGCSSNGGFNVKYAPNVYSVCAPVWGVSPNGRREYAAFAGMLTDSATGGPLLMNAGDTITDHQYATAAQDGMHITVTDLTTGHAGTIILNGHDGPLMPAFSVQKLGNALGWGLVNDAPNALVWEIGHTGNYTSPAGQFCLPGSASKPACYSYNIPSWLQFSPLQIKGVTFGDGSSATGWSVVSDFGGKAEVNQDCGAANYGTPFCYYPWYALNGAANAFTYGGDYPGTTNDFGQADQFQQAENCASPADGSPQYCSTVLSQGLKK